MNQGDDAADVIQERVRHALAENAALKIFAGRTKSFLGRHHQGIPLDLSALTGIISYEPNELVLVALPGTKLSEIEALCHGENQYFAFEPPAWGAAATIGGTVACNLSGPRRFKMGALRDHLLGAELIDGRGERIRTGGKVVKNVTGYDLSKVLAGSFGTLGVLTEVCLKVWPCPETQATLFIHGLTPTAALARILVWAARPLQITGLVCDADRLAARVEGPAPAVRKQLATLREEESAESEIIEEAESQAFWRHWRELEWLVPAEGQQRWRFSGPPTKMAQLMKALEAEGLSQWGLDWAGGLLWALLPVAAQAAHLHRIAARHQAIGWRFAADDHNEDAFTPLSTGAARMNKMLKRALDPQGIFNPGKMYA
ncbi:MAG: glycolate oxidase subunit GlcE [Gemmatimonadota bacterium]|nr:glycolate oxidase subunit GlcE [Gemmatimonadota bacterium]